MEPLSWYSRYSSWLFIFVGGFRALFAERDFKTRNQKQRTGWGLVQRSRALSEGEAEKPMGAPPMDIPHFAIQSAHHLKFKTCLLTVC